MLLKITEKIIQENAFEQEKKKPTLNLTLGQALIGLQTTGPRVEWGTVRAKCLAKEHNTIIPAGPEPGTTDAANQSANHWATVP